jgi:tyrosyl-tRNA synthetase
MPASDFSRASRGGTSALETGLESHSVNPMLIKKRLAREIVTLLRGSDDAARAEQHFESVVQRKDFSETDVPVRSLSEILNGQPSIAVLDLLVATAVPNRSAARRLIDQGGVRLNSEKVGVKWSVSTENLPIELRAGKRRAVRFR